MDDENETNLLDDLAEAWEASEEETDAVQDNGEETPSTPANELSADEPASADEQPADTGVVQGAEGEDTAPEKGDEQSSDIAPKSMSAAAREVWKDVPDAVKQEFTRLDERVAGMAEKYGNDARRAQDMDRSLAPFQQFFAMNGGAGQTLPAVLQTASILQMGTPLQKAEMVKNMITQFGVDIKTLDSMLVGEQPQQEQPQNVEQIIANAFAQRDQQQLQYQNQQQQAEIDNEVATFANDPKNEFYNDVKDTMADLMDLAANQGKQLSMKDAYDRACQLDTQIAGILQARNAQKDVNQRRQAASSISGVPSGEGSTSQAGSLRDTIEQAFAEAGRA